MTGPAFGAIATGDAGTVVVWLIAYSLFAVLCTAVSLLALLTRRRVARPQAVLWEYFALVGVAGALYGVAGLVGTAGVALDSAVAAFGAVLDGLLLAFAFLCALAMREAYFNATLSNVERDRLGEFPLRQGFELALVGVVVVVGLGSLLWRGPALPTLAGVAGVAVVLYGGYFQRKRTGQPATRGTLIDTLLRQLLPVLVFAGGALAATLLYRLAVDPVVVETVAGVFVVMAATALMTVTIKLRQHLAGYR